MSVHRSDDGQQDEFQTFLTVGLIRLRQCPCEESETTIPGGIIQNCTIAYPVDGNQYIAVLTGYGISQTSGPPGAGSRHHAAARPQRHLRLRPALTAMESCLSGLIRRFDAGTLVCKRGSSADSSAM